MFSEKKHTQVIKAFILCRALAFQLFEAVERLRQKGAHYAAEKTPGMSFHPPRDGGLVGLHPETGSLNAQVSSRPRALCLRDGDCASSPGHSVTRATSGVRTTGPDDPLGPFQPQSRDLRGEKRKESPGCYFSARDCFPLGGKDGRLCTLSIDLLQPTRVN